MYIICETQKAEHWYTVINFEKFFECFTLIDNHSDVGDDGGGGSGGDDVRRRIRTKNECGMTIKYFIIYTLSVQFCLYVDHSRTLFTEVLNSIVSRPTRRRTVRGAREWKYFIILILLLLKTLTIKKGINK